MAICRFCGRDRHAPCMNTRDMDPDDGFNFDPVCHDALADLGGGERLRTREELADFDRNGGITLDEIKADLSEKHYGRTSPDRGHG